MKKGLIGFFVGLFVLLVVFCIVTFILADTHNVSFFEEIVSWFGGTIEKTVETTASARIGM